MEFYGIKRNGKAVYPPAIAEQARLAWEKIPEGGRFKKSLTQCRPQKTQNQLGAIWGLMIATAVEELDCRGYDTSFLLNTPLPTGNAITKDLLCKYLYEVCPIYNDEGIRITLSKADTKQASKFFDDCRNFMASQWQIVIPEPERIE